MKIVLTGATGLIGHALCRELLKQGHEVVGIVRNIEKARSALPYPVEFVAWSELKQSPPQVQTSKALEGCDVVIHLAGESVAEGRWTALRKKALRDSRIQSTQTLVQALAGLPKAPQVFIGASAIGYYGNRGDEELTEASKPGPENDFLSKLCQDWENASVSVESAGTRRVLIRIGMVLAPRGGALAKLIPIFKKYLGGSQGSGSQWMSWIHLDDLIEAVLFTLRENKISGPVNLVAPEPVRNSEFSAKLGNALHRPTVFGAPSFALKLALGEMATIILTGQKVLPGKLLGAGFQFKFKSLAEALRNVVGDERNIKSEEFFVEQWVPKPIEKVFDFFCEAKNLEALTPDFVQFQILRQTDDFIVKNTEIEYQLKIHGFPIRWKTLIEDIKKNEYFIDTQLKGPYKKWHHTHRFEAMKGGTLISDRVLYQLPVGALGSLVAGKFVRKDVEGIFDYRRQIITKTFGA
jgi:uncharacterized protein (TIGR01777 family)